MRRAVAVAPQPQARTATEVAEDGLEQRVTWLEVGPDKHDRLGRGLCLLRLELLRPA